MAETGLARPTAATKVAFGIPSAIVIIIYYDGIGP
jgi:hypothetical protein